MSLLKASEKANDIRSLISGYYKLESRKEESYSISQDDGWNNFYSRLTLLSKISRTINEFAVLLGFSVNKDSLVPQIEVLEKTFNRLIDERH